MPRPEQPDTGRPPTTDTEPAQSDAVTARIRESAGVAALVAEAEATWRERARANGDPEDARPGWRTFEDAFPTFYEFTNRPR